MTEIVVIEQCFGNRWEARFHLSMGRFSYPRGKHRDRPPRLVARGDFAGAAAAPAERVPVGYVFTARLLYR